MSMRIYAITQNTSDYGEKFVVRGWTLEPGVTTPDPQPLGVSDTIEEARSVLPEGLYRLPHNEGEDLVIVETWI